MDPFDQVFYPTFAAGCALGALSAWSASGRGPVGQVLLLLLAALVVWFSLILAVGWGYDAWQSMPDPPDEAFADGAKLTGSVLFGWLPSRQAFELNRRVPKWREGLSKASHWFPAGLKPPSAGSHAAWH